MYSATQVDNYNYD